MKAFRQWSSWHNLKKNCYFPEIPWSQLKTRITFSFADRDFPTSGLTCERFLLFLVLFNMHDTDNDGTITLEEYRKVSE